MTELNQRICSFNGNKSNYLEKFLQLYREFLSRTSLLMVTTAPSGEDVDKTLYNIYIYTIRGGFINELPSDRQTDRQN